MKQYLYIFILGTVMIPSVAFASWWNPLSWFDLRIVRTPQAENQSQKQTPLAPTSTATRVNDTNTSVTINNISDSVIKPVSQPNSPEKQVVVHTPIFSEVIKDDAPSLTVGEPYVTQTIFSGYGGYEIRLKVTAKGDNFYIPMTTTDSTKGMTGFSYSIKGGEFKGIQTSKVTCSTYKDTFLISGENMGSQCFVTKGTSLDITATIWLTNRDYGNYSVLFNKLGYFRDGDHKMAYYKLDTETESLYLK